MRFRIPGCEPEDTGTNVRAAIKNKRLFPSGQDLSIEAFGKDPMFAIGHVVLFLLKALIDSQFVGVIAAVEDGNVLTATDDFYDTQVRGNGWVDDLAAEVEDPSGRLIGNPP